MKEYLDADNEFLSLVINYPYLLDNTIVKPEYLKKEYSKLYEILLEEHKVSKEFIIDKLMKYKDFNVVQYAEIGSSLISFASRDVKFNELEKFFIERYKNEQFLLEINNYNGDCTEFYEKLTKINELNYNENEYIKAKDMFETLSTKNLKINLGYNYLDYSLNLSQHDLLILAGGTGTGKTAFALNLLNNLSRDYQCIYFNMEMSKNILYKRLIGIRTDIPLKELNNLDSLTNEQKVKVKESMFEIERRKIILINKALDIKEIKKNIANIKTNKHIVVFVDHIGLIKSRGNSLYEKMTNIAKELRAISLNYDCTIIGLCQLSRESQKSNEAPKLQDLRDSGEIEQSSRKVLLLYNKSEKKEERIQDMEIIIAKNDDGDKLRKSFKFDRFTQHFTEVYTERNR